LGLIGNAVADETSYADPTSFGRAIGGQVYVAGTGRPSSGGWTGFTKGECLHFCLVENKLTMFSVTKAMYFVIGVVPAAGVMFIHFNFHRNGTILTLEPLAARDYTELVMAQARGYRVA
jgi:hypothetical protein